MVNKIRIFSLSEEDYRSGLIADLLSDDPLLLEVIGRRFKLVSFCDRKNQRVTYQFRRMDDGSDDEILTAGL